MKFKPNFYPKRRRGLSTIVGGLIFIVLMTSAFSMLGAVLQSQNDYGDAAKMVANADLAKQQEDFDLTSIFQPVAGFLEIELTNQGQNTAEMFTVVMTNKTDTGEPTRTFEIPNETSFLPVGDETPTNIVSTLNLKMDIPAPAQTEDYDFKVISSLGTIKMLTITCDGTSQICGVVPPPAPPGTASLSAELFLDGPVGINTKISTVIMFVQNTGTVPLEDVYPTQEACLVGTFPTVQELGVPDDIAGDFTGCTLTPAQDPNCGSGPSPGGNNDGLGICLAPGQTAIFKWDGTVVGDIDDILDFCNQIQGQEYDDTVVGPSPAFGTCDALTVIDPNDCDGCGPGGETIILLDDLLVKPSMFLTIPSPFGDAQAAKGIWGINVANPTNTSIEVPRVVLTSTIPGANDNAIMFDDSGGSDCDPISVGSPSLPAISQNWFCNQENVMVWQDYTNPVVLAPYTVQSFIAKVQPGSSSAPNGVAVTMVLSANTFSSIGSFAKTGYQALMLGGSTQNPGITVNTYISPVVNGVADDEIEITRVNIDDETVQSFNVVLADFDLDSNHAIGIGTKLIINVPRDWHTVGVDACVGFDAFGPCDEPTITLHDDGSYQIVATTTELIGNIDDAIDARTVTFHATAPDVEADKMFIMHILANGITDIDNSPVAPLSEVILHVLP